MLILTRRIGERLRINDEVIVTILEIKGNQIRIGVSAPKDIAVHREEIYRKSSPEQKAESVNKHTDPSQYSHHNKYLTNLDSLLSKS